MENFTPVSALIGDAFIGLSAVIMLAGNGRIAGISGILGGAISSRGDERRWRILFLAGLLLATLLYQIVSSSPITIEAQASPELLVIAGLLVGFGTRLGSGCTSGHGICGIARFSKRSFAATVMFMLFGFITVYVTRHLLELGV
ncbi:MAG: YeeE/YedE family protein [Proteobacteria bacterium]|nr:YeeE/YedE family protein [Pseudomonadota bacterium]MDA0895983.1 YeeE/YedE family protein [Pseudomonadota bacterium]MDA1243885.1 YeeE/YedE family protein [Pseudomonadota bacterium]